VLGWPVSHSLSPLLHRFWLEQYGIHGSYEAIPTPPDSLQDTLKRLVAEGFAGANLTLPLKEQVLPWLDSIDPSAKRIGAVNTLVIEDSKIHGRNTDAYGFIANLRAHGVDLAGGAACVVGAGGAARAVVAGLLDEGAYVLLTNRTQDRSLVLARELGGNINVIPWEQREQCLGDVRLVVNTTSQGMKGAPPLLLSLDYLPVKAVVSDIIYTPLLTPLLEEARLRGHPVVDGLGMLIYQAQPAFAAWFGVTPEVTPALRAHILEAL